jgi:hypothetical protein
MVMAEKFIPSAGYLLTQGDLKAERDGANIGVFKSLNFTGQTYI